MKLLRHGPEGREKPGMLASDGTMGDLAAHVPDIAGAALSPAGLARLAALDPAALDPAALPEVPAGTRLGPPVSGCTQLICIGPSCADHAAETGASIPGEPIVFLKANGAISGPHDDVVIPKDSRETDWEVELCVVVGERASCVSEERALDHVAGCAVGNDASEREWQIERTVAWGA